MKFIFVFICMKKNLWTQNQVCVYYRRGQHVYVHLSYCLFIVCLLFFIYTISV